MQAVSILILGILTPWKLTNWGKHVFYLTHMWNGRRFPSQIQTALWWLGCALAFLSVALRSLDGH